jgi:hypothetical protein
MRLARPATVSDRFGDLFAADRHKIVSQNARPVDLALVAPNAGAGSITVQ